MGEGFAFVLAFAKPKPRLAHGAYGVGHDTVMMTGSVEVASLSMTFGRVAEALPRAIRLDDWPKLVMFFFFILTNVQATDKFMNSWVHMYDML